MERPPLNHTIFRPLMRMQNTPLSLLRPMRFPFAPTLHAVLLVLGCSFGLDEAGLAAQSALETSDVIYRDVGTWTDHLPYSMPRKRFTVEAPIRQQEKTGSGRFVLKMEFFLSSPMGAFKPSPKSTE